VSHYLIKSNQKVNGLVFLHPEQFCF